MFNESQRNCLLKTARDSIKYGFETGRALPIHLPDYDPPLCEQGACFVTLQINNQLRGCIGSLEAYRPLIEDVAENAFAAAFRDPRFSPLDYEEFDQLHYHLSILDKPEPLEFSSETDLLKKIRPGIDGLILHDKGYRGTFLPSVWESLPEPELFLSHLKQKAGLPSNYWSDTIQIEHYTVEDIE